MLQISNRAFRTGNNNRVKAIQIGQIFLHKADVNVRLILKDFHIRMIGNIRQANNAQIQRLFRRQSRPMLKINA